jgi:hypothetical protein
MRIAPKVAIALALALLALPNVSTAAYAADSEFCDLEQNRDADECKREKPKLQTRFFSD